MALDKPHGRGITIEDLVRLPHLGLQVRAGHAGAGRRIVQAQVCDSRDPWDWLDVGDLVMTCGWILPWDPQDQVAFVERMNAEGVCALTVGGEPPPDAPYPDASQAMIDACERIGFPLLFIDYSMHWTPVLQAVSAANEGGEEALSLTHIMRINHEVRLSLTERRPSATFLENLGDALDSSIYLVHRELWEAALPESELPDQAWLTALREALDDRGGLIPTIIRLRVEDQLGLVVGLPAEKPTVAIVIPNGDHIPRLAVLQHVAAACAMEMSRIDAGVERERRSGAEMLSAALEGRLDASVFESRLGERDFEPPWHCMAIQADRPMVDRLVRRWTGRAVPHLITGVEPNYVAMLPAAHDVLDKFEETALAEGLRAGVSDPFAGANGLIDATRQAKWALETLTQQPAGLAFYGRNSDLFLPRTLADARLAAENTLGPLLDYDDESGSELVETLRVYLECNRSPKRTADQLFIHNQTVHYRIKRIEELTGRSMRATADVSYLWFGLRALALSSDGS
ncbi:MAG: PucR family transcriptional regulator ligand-binding domain-containing protein [Actinobacteria bacterium]|nr:PucR family transcriptional regulator ligand-binding domain-containing protein [Actinomycetota bacterium]